MSNPKPQNYIFCPFCAGILETKIEEGRPIKYCLEHGKFYPKHDITVGGIAVRFNPIGRYLETLMVLRKKEPHLGKWSFPAGFVSYGELPDHALVREVREETGLTVVRYKLLEERVSDDDPRSPKQQARYFKMVVTGNTKVSDKEEIAGLKWYRLDIDTVPEIAWGHHETLFKRMKARGGLDMFIREYDWLSHYVAEGGQK